MDIAEIEALILAEMARPVDDVHISVAALVSAHGLTMWPAGEAMRRLVERGVVERRGAFGHTQYRLAANGARPAGPWHHSAESRAEARRARAYHVPLARRTQALAAGAAKLDAAMPGQNLQLRRRSARPVQVTVNPDVVQSSTGSSAATCADAGDVYGVGRA